MTDPLPEVKRDLGTTLGATVGLLGTAGSIAAMAAKNPTAAIIIAGGTIGVGALHRYMQKSRTVLDNDAVPGSKFYLSVPWIHARSEGVGGKLKSDSGVTAPSPEWDKLHEERAARDRRSRLRLSPAATDAECDSAEVLEAFFADTAAAPAASGAAPAASGAAPAASGAAPAAAAGPGPASPDGLPAGMPVIKVKEAGSLYGGYGVTITDDAQCRYVGQQITAKLKANMEYLKQDDIITQNKHGTGTPKYAVYLIVGSPTLERSFSGDMNMMFHPEICITPSYQLDENSTTLSPGEYINTDTRNFKRTIGELVSTNGSRRLITGFIFLGYFEAHIDRHSHPWGSDERIKDTLIDHIHRGFELPAFVVNRYNENPLPEMKGDWRNDAITYKNKSYNYCTTFSDILDKGSDTTMTALQSKGVTIQGILANHKYNETDETDETEFTYNSQHYADLVLNVLRCWGGEKVISCVDGSGAVLYGSAGCQHSVSREKAGKDKYWIEMTADEQKAGLLLGWTGESWDDGSAAPMKDLFWNGMSVGQRAAAKALGHSAATWDLDMSSEAEGLFWKGMSVVQGAGRHQKTTSGKGNAPRKQSPKVFNRVGTIIQEIERNDTRRYDTARRKNIVADGNCMPASILFGLTESRPGAEKMDDAGIKRGVDAMRNKLANYRREMTKAVIGGKLWIDQFDATLTNTGADGNQYHGYQGVGMRDPNQSVKDRVREYIDIQGNTNTNAHWGSLELRDWCRLEDIEVRLYEDHTMPMVFTRREVEGAAKAKEPDENTIHIWYNGVNHYMAVVNYDHPAEPAPVQHRGAVSPSDDVDNPARGGGLHVSFTPFTSKGENNLKLNLHQGTSRRLPSPKGGTRGMSSWLGTNAARGVKPTEASVSDTQEEKRRVLEEKRRVLADRLAHVRNQLPEDAG
jgi:hypothetical protein